MRLNKFIAHCGLGTRRTAAELVKKGEISVNGKVETNPGYTVAPNDKVLYGGKLLTKVKGYKYFLLNKPTGYEDTVSEKSNTRKTVDLIKNHEQKLYPSDTLNAITCGLMLYTSDKDLHDKLSKPSLNINRVYQITLSTPLSNKHLEELKTNNEISYTNISYINNQPKTDVGIEINEGTNDQIILSFTQLGYTVTKLDRTYFHGLTKKDLPRGYSRELTKEELIRFKHFIH